MMSYYISHSAFGYEINLKGYTPKFLWYDTFEEAEDEAQAEIIKRRMNLKKKK